MPHFPAVQRGTNAQTSTTCVASTLVAQHSHSYIAHTARMNNSAQTGRAKDKSKCQSAPPPPLARDSQKWRVWDSCPTEHRTQHAHAFTHPPSAPLAAYALEPSAYSCDGASSRVENMLFGLSFDATSNLEGAIMMAELKRSRSDLGSCWSTRRLRARFPEASASACAFPI